jgi:hypothetical protein
LKIVYAIIPGKLAVPAKSSNILSNGSNSLTQGADFVKYSGFYKKWVSAAGEERLLTTLFFCLRYVS